MSGPLGRRNESKSADLAPPEPCEAGCRKTPNRGDASPMASTIECPRCGTASANLVDGVCRACFMRDYHQKRSASAAAECPRCRAVSANFVHGMCRACFMRDYHQKRSASVVTDKQVTDKQTVFEAPTFIDDGQGRRLCVECREPGVYARGLCLNCYMRDRRRRTRMKFCTCAICGASFQSTRRDALYCSAGCRHKAHRAGKGRRALDIGRKVQGYSPV